SWGVAEAPTLLRRGDLVYLFVSGGTWDSAFYHIYWVAAPTVEALSWENPDRLAGRFLVPSDDQSFGHGSVVLGPDAEQLYMVHHRLRHGACVTGDCARDVWLTPLDFEDRGDGRGEVWVVPRWPAEGTEVAVAMP
ncbi:MAG: family 43 glycosylhydrolase, partial [Myxococcota bacterium]